MSKKQIEADTLEEDYKNLKPIKEMVSNWTEGGEYLSCPECKFVLDKTTSIEDSIIHSVVVCGKCSSEWEVFGKLVGYRKYQRK
ncbi:hypothetical protein ES704_01492 [subsurface metagenome]